MSKRRPVFESLEARLCMAAPTFQTAFELPLTGSWTPTVYRASPLFVDIFNSGKDDFISVTANAQIVAYAEGPNGSATPIMTYTVPGGVADIKSTPVVVFNPLTGRKDLFAGMGRDETNPGSIEDGRVFGWDLQTGQLLPAFANGVSTGHNVGGQSGVYGAITTGQLEGNGLPDLVVTSFSHNVTAIRLDGSVLWSWTNDDTVLSGAVVGDIDRSGTPSVVVGGDSSNNGFYQAGGWVNVLSNTGVLKWRHFIPGEVTWSSPVLADLNNNGNLDIVIGTGLNYQNQGVAGSQVAGDNIYAFDPLGNILVGWPYATTAASNPAPHEVLGSLAVADLLGNGNLDIVAIDRAGYVHAIQPNGQDLPGFAGGKPIAPDLPAADLPDDYASPIIADVTGGGTPDIIASAGPYLRAFDNKGNLITIATTQVIAPATTPEGIDASAAVGNFDGSGGLTLAFVSYNVGLANRPDQVQIFQLPASNLTPPWPFQRRTIAGDAVKRSPAFDHQFIVTAFNATLGTIPNQATLQPYDDALDADSLSLLGIGLYLTSTTAVRQAEVQRVYQEFLGVGADPGGLNFWTNYLTTNTYASMEVQFASGSNFLARAGYQPYQEVVQLYQAILGRTPSSGEVNSYLAINQPTGYIAQVFLNSQEYINDQLSKFYPPAFGPGTQNTIPADAIAAYAYDIHHGAREETIEADILTSGGQYAATNFEAAYTRTLFRDLLHRQASSGEVAAWVGLLDSGQVTIAAMANIFQNGTEARTDYINQEYETLLGRQADSGALSGLLNYANREVVVLAIVGSTEYYNRTGGNPTAFVTAMYTQLGGIAVDASSLNYWVGKISTGTPTVVLGQGLIYGGPLYFHNLIVNELFQYLPDESQGVLRSGDLSPTAAGQPINPDPGTINYLVGLYGAGFNDENVISVMLNVPYFYTRAYYYMGIYQSPGIRD